MLECQQKQKVVRRLDYAGGANCNTLNAHMFWKRCWVLWS